MTESSGATELIMGLMAGAFGFGLLAIPKAIIDVAAWIAGKTALAETVKGATDLTIGGVVLYDTATKPKDDFWRGAGWSFGILEALFGGYALASGLSELIGKPIPSPSLEAEKKLIEALSGKKYD